MLDRASVCAPARALTDVEAGGVSVFALSSAEADEMPQALSSEIQICRVDAEALSSIETAKADCRVLSERIQALPGRLCVLMIDETKAVLWSFGAIRKYNYIGRATPWDLAMVVSSGCPEYKMGELVRVKNTDGLQVDGGVYDTDTLTLSQGIMKSGQELRFYRPLRQWDTYKKGKTTRSQFDISGSVVGI